jgi:hypothetical protein
VHREPRPDGWQEDTSTSTSRPSGIGRDEPFVAHDLLTDERFAWQGPSPVRPARPAEAPGHLLHLRPVGS